MLLSWLLVASFKKYYGYKKIKKIYQSQSVPASPKETSVCPLCILILLYKMT